jgi:hypothetical protein
MFMNRRSFISGLIRVGAFAAFDPHRVIFDFGRKLFVPMPISFKLYGSPIGSDSFVELFDSHLDWGSPIFIMNRELIESATRAMTGTAAHFYKNG